MDIRSTDDVGFYDEIFIDVQGMKVNIEGRGGVDVAQLVKVFITFLILITAR